MSSLSESAPSRPGEDVREPREIWMTDPRAMSMEGDSICAEKRRKEGILGLEAVNIRCCPP